MRVEEILFLETNDSCAYCGIKQRENLTIHHIDGNPQNNEYDNQIVLCHNCHHRYENKKGISSQDIKEKKRNLIRATLTPPGMNALKIAKRKGFAIAPAVLLFHVVDMGYLALEKDLVDYSEDGDSESVAIWSEFTITEKGKRLYEKWFD